MSYARRSAYKDQAYTRIIVAFCALLFGTILLRRRGLPERPHPLDVILVGAAAQKIGRTVATSAVTGVMREAAPEGSALRELLSCHTCSGVWTAGFLGAGLLLAPRATRHVAGVFAALALSDVTHAGWAVLDKAAH